MNFYRQESSNPKWNAQRNLSGRTHYVDDDTLRFHKSRILSAHSTCNGLIFYVIESVALNMQNTRRGVRYVLFDVFGQVIGTRSDLEHCYKRSEQAIKAMYAEINTLDPQAHTLAEIDRQEKQHARECADMRVKVRALALKQAA